MKNLAVLITVYNDTEPLKAALDSISEPSCDFTVVVVDDGSDQRLDLDIEKYPFEIEVLHLAENKGAALAANAGLEFIRSKGFSVVARLDAGDLQKPGRLTTQYQYLQDHPELVLIGSNVVFRDENSGKELFTTKLPQTWDAIKKWSVFRNCFIHPAIMFRLSRLDDQFKYRTDYPHVEDYIFAWQIAKEHPSVVLKEPLLDCFVREQGISRKNDRSQLLAGIRYRLHHPEILNILWWAYIAKRLAYLITPFPIRSHLKGILGATDPLKVL